MKTILALSLASAALWTSHAMAAPVTYYIHSTHYDGAVNATACPVGNCGVLYTTQQKLSGSITFFGPLDPNLVDEDVDMPIKSFSISDGQTTYSDSDWFSTVWVNSARVSTDSSGALTAFEFKFDRTFTNTHTIGSDSDLQSRVSSVWLSSAPSPGMAVVSHNNICSMRGDNVDGRTEGAGCMTTAGTPAKGTSSATATGVSLSLIPPSPPAPIPSLSEWAMILLGAALAGWASLTLNRRRKAHGQST